MKRAHQRCPVLLAHRYYYMFKLVSLAFSLLMFFLTSYWTSPEILNLFISVTVSMYCIWCIWSLRKFRIPASLSVYLYANVSVLKSHKSRLKAWWVR